MCFWGRIAPLPGDTDGDGDIDEDDGCQDVHAHVGPLLTTEWYQYDEFNDSAPYLGCNYGEQAQAGCVAVAMAQVMNFHEFPNTYSWGDMHNTIATDATAQLMRDIGDAVDMNWGCDVSFAEATEVASSLKDDFGYSTANYLDYHRDAVVYELNRNRPVILGGSDGGSVGHAWVCDGYASSTYCDNGTSYLVFHMNWGLIGGMFNGYFGYTNWYPGGSSLNENRKMITNIKP